MARWVWKTDPKFAKEAREPEFDFLAWFREGSRLNLEQKFHGMQYQINSIITYPFTFRESGGMPAWEQVERFVGLHRYGIRTRPTEMRPNDVMLGGRESEIDIKFIQTAASPLYVQGVKPKQIKLCIVKYHSRLKRLVTAEYE